MTLIVLSERSCENEMGVPRPGSGDSGEGYRCGGSLGSASLLLSCGARDRESLGIALVDLSARGAGENLIEDVGKLQVVFVARDVTDMRRADDVGHIEQRV